MRQLGAKARSYLSDTCRGKMELRVLINTHRTPAIAASCAIIIVVALLCLNQLRSGGRPPLPVIAGRAFFTTDDGATLFADSIDRDPPFDHDGKPAVRAYVFACGNGAHRWIQYLEKLSDDGAKQMDLIRNSPPGTAAGLDGHAWLVKPPGSGAWIPRSDGASRAIMKPACPDDSDPATIREVNPR